MWMRRGRSGGGCAWSRRVGCGGLRRGGLLGRSRAGGKVGGLRVTLQF